MEYKYGIKNGVPYSGNDTELFTQLSKDMQEKCIDWVLAFCVPCKSQQRYRTSYGMKHTLEACTGIYLTNNQFKDLMLRMEIIPIDEHELNWTFKLKEAPLKLADRYGRCKRAGKVLYHD